MRRSVFSPFLGLFLGLFLFGACATTPPAPIQVETLAEPPEGTFGEETATTMRDTPSVVPPQGMFVPDPYLKGCQRQVRNAPASTSAGYISTYSQLVVVDEVLALATVPVNGACLSSGFGPRFGRQHKGLDISAPRGTWIYSGAPGIVREAGWGGSFGNYILIDHGYGIFTRYAHMDAFVEGLDVGTQVGFGWPIGQVGNTSTRRVGVHVHYEVLTGNYNNPKLSFGLAARDPFSFPAYVPPPAPVQAPAG